MLILEQEIKDDISQYKSRIQQLEDKCSQLTS
jgi:hypothetical protein